MYVDLSLTSARSSADLVSAQSLIWPLLASPLLKAISVAPQTITLSFHFFLAREDCSCRVNLVQLAIRDRSVVLHHSASPI